MPGAGYSFGAVIDVQLTIDVGGVGLDGPLGHDELPRYLSVGFALRHELQHFHLAFREGLGQVACFSAWNSCFGRMEESIQHALGEFLLARSIQSQVCG